FLSVVAVNRVLRRRGFWNGVRAEPDLLSLLDLVALGTIADVVRLEGLNRAFVAKGLLAMRRRERPGLTALMDVARLSGPPEPWHRGQVGGGRDGGGRMASRHPGPRGRSAEEEIRPSGIRDCPRCRLPGHRLRALHCRRRPWPRGAPRRRRGAAHEGGWSSDG